MRPLRVGTSTIVAGARRGVAGPTRSLAASCDLGAAGERPFDVGFDQPFTVASLMPAKLFAPSHPLALTAEAELAVVVLKAALWPAVEPGVAA